jgi:hypothetical protein
MKEFLAAHTVEALGIAIAAITAIGVFVGPWLASRRQRRIAEQDRKLRAHFENLKKEAELVISSASNLAPMAYSWKIVVSQGPSGGNVSDINETKVSRSFEVHFSEQAKRLNALKQGIYEHNTNCEKLRQKTKTAFGSQGIPVVQNDQGNHSICIFEAALDALFTRWKELARSNRPWPDFQNISSNPVQGGYLLHPREWESSMVAFAKTEDERDKCELALAEIADNVENQREVSEIVNKGDKLIVEGKEFANQLASEINDIGEFWRGRRGKEFKELKKTCPRCKELF